MGTVVTVRAWGGVVAPFVRVDGILCLVLDCVAVWLLLASVFLYVSCSFTCAVLAHCDVMMLNLRSGPLPKLTERREMLFYLQVCVVT